MAYEDKKILTREKRLTTISHYDSGRLTLADELSGQEIRQRIRTFTQDSKSELLYALQVLSAIEDVAVVVHGAAGCAAAGACYQKKYGRGSWYSTNLDEKDTILGGDDKLRDTILRVYEERQPKAIFVAGTPVIAINNDDISSILLELETEIEAKLIFIDTDGFKTKAGINGYDVVAHALQKNIVAPPESEKQPFLNIISFSEKEQDIRNLTKLLEAIGIAWNLIPQYGSYESIRSASKASGSIVLNKDEGAYFAQALEEKYQVPYIRTDLPAGTIGIRHFLHKLSEKGWADEKAVAAYEEASQNALKRYLGKKILKDQKVFLNSDIGRVKAYAGLIQELGGEIAGIAVPFVDPENKKELLEIESENKALPIVVLSGQPFELANVVRKTHSDIYISEDGDFRFLNESECIPFSLKNVSCIGYEGIRSIAERIELVQKRFHNLKFQGAYFESIYPPEWLTKSSNWYIKQEVK